MGQSAPRSPWRRLPRIPLIVGLVLLLGVVGFFAVRHLQARPMHQALENAHAAFAEVEQQVAQASDVPALNAAGTEAAGARSTIADELARIDGKDGDLAEATRAVLTGQDRYLVGIEGLSGLNDKTLTEWGTTAEALATGEAELTAAVERLAAVDEGDAERVAPDDTGREHVVEVVGAFAATSLAGATNDLLLKLVGIDTTEQMREIATTAVDAKAVVSAAATGLPEGSQDLADVQAYGAALEQIAALRSIGRENLDRWDENRSAFQQAVAAAPGLDAGDDAASRITEVVDAGKRKMSEWREAYDAVVRSKRDDLETLDGFESYVKERFAEYGDLRQSMSDFVDRVEREGESYGEISTFLEDAITARSQLQLSFEDGAPIGFEDAHPAEFVELIGRATSIISQVKDDFLYETPCTDICRHWEVPSWDDLHRESDAITQELGPATAEWQEEIHDYRAEINGRPVPQAPRV